MRRRNSEAWQAAVEDFGDADLKDRRRSDRLVAMAAGVYERPSGLISEVFRLAADLHGAYDFVENDKVAPSSLIEALGRATARRSAGLPFVYVVVDGSSITLADHAKKKDFGTLGSGKRSSRGLKVMNALAVDPLGATLGLVAQEYWTRPKRKKKSSAKRASLRPEEKETKHWIAVMEEASRQCAAVGVKPHFIIDREGDAHDLLLTLKRIDASFTVRASWDRVVDSQGKDKQYLRATLAKSEPLGIETLKVPGSRKRQARNARLEIRAERLLIRLRCKRTKKNSWVEMTTVWLREVGTTPAGEKPLDWLLYTTVPVRSIEDARQVVRTYEKRWRIEDFHKTWKSGVCNIEKTQLRSANAVIKWATMLAGHAARVERLKHLSREQPEKPASEELTPDEIRLLVVLARAFKKRSERPPTTSLTMREATEWIARLGGYTGKSSGGPPGSITIGRGLEYLKQAVEVARILRESERRGQ